MSEQVHVDQKPCPKCKGPNYTEKTSVLSGGSERIEASCPDCRLWKITYPEKRVKK